MKLRLLLIAINWLKSYGQKLRSFRIAALLPASCSVFPPTSYFVSIVTFSVVLSTSVANISNSFAATISDTAATAATTGTVNPGSNLVDNVSSQALDNFREDDEIEEDSESPDFDFLGFDHLTTGFRLEGLHASLDCQACHTDGVFNELPTLCSACHDDSFAIGKPVVHIRTDEDCVNCHNAFGFQVMAVNLFNHNLIGAATCLSCHNGIDAIGKGALHVPSADTCETCHTFVGWIPATFDHTGLNQPCTSCHSPGSFASPKTSTHINTSDVCESCHSVLAWSPVIQVDHAEVIGICATCHNGVSRLGSGQLITSKSSTHIESSTVCDACHTTQAWLPTFAVDHDQITGSCFSCHNGIDATGKKVDHIDTTNLCENCHKVTVFAPVSSVDHTQVNGVCSFCHDGTIATGKTLTHPPTTAECDVCHNTLAWLPALGTIDHSGFVDNCISCHDGVTASGKSAAHVPTSDACQLCHQVFPAQWTPVAPSAVDHSAVIGSCISCHDTVIASGKSDLHIPTTDVCDACHQQPPAQWTPVDVAAVDHAEVTGGCVSCHDGVIASGKSLTHINASDNCDACHAKAPARWAPVLSVAVDHTEVIGSCFSCHDTIIASGRSTTHIPTTTECQTCHDVAPATWVPVLVDRVDHSQVVGSCISCHDTVIASGKSAAHMLTSNVCDACHEPGPAKWTPLVTGAFNHAEALGTCSSCHDGVTATGKHPLHIATQPGEDCNACHSTKAWLPSAVDHSTFVDNCISCHNGSNASGKNTSHLNTSDLCEKCHVVFPGLWTTVPAQAVDHAEVIGSCISCHNTVNASGKSATHITTSDVCDACHQVVPAAWTPVAVAAIDHAQVTGTCVSCHDTVIASGKSNLHMPTSDVCDACHAVVPSAWTPLLAGAFSHQEVSAACSVCHNTVIATGKHALHIVTADECDSCHTTIAWLPAAVDHSTFVNNCISCHDGVTASGKGSTGAIHINSSDLCETCHAVFPASWMPATAVDHTQVLGLCVSCHDTVIASGRSTSHIATDTACEACHQVPPAGWTPVLPQAVDHTKVIGSCISCHDTVIASGKNPVHIETTNVCEACHQTPPAKWAPVLPTAVDHAQIVGSCISCHDGVIASGKSTAHITSTDVCDACHLSSPAKWTPVLSAAVDHTQTLGVCSSCHDGTIATGKHATHVVTTEECDTCHNSNAWVPAAVDHSTLTNNCISCHDNVIASGRGSTGATHIATTNLCENCHQVFPARWTPVLPAAVDHTQVQGLCINCHDGVIASGRSTTHINTSNNCDACHGLPPLKWTPVLPAAVDHSQVVGVCSSCHDGVVARGKGPNHIATGQECDACHDTINWLNVTVVDHTGFTNNCISCHDGISASGKTTAHISTSNVCDACHQIFPATWVPVVKTAVDHQQVLGSCISCHDTVIASGKSAAHIPSSDTCDLCHQQGPQQWTPVLPAAVDHSQVIGTCISCHDGVIASGRSAQHINTTTTCQACHGVPPALWAPLAAGAFDHTQVLGACITCHNGTTATGKSTQHISTTDVCEACHGVPPALWTPLATGAFDHAQALGACATCHDGVTATGKHALHITTTQACDVCHTSTAWLPANVDHTGFTGNCIACHNGTNASGKSTAHIASTDACELCHAVFPTTWTPVAPSAVNHAAVLGTCNSCHTPGGVATPKSTTHPATSNTCDACHFVPPQSWLPFIAPLNHNEVMGSCVSCHVTGGLATGKSNNHLSSSDNCQLCHNVPPQNWTSIILPLNHNEVTGTCVSCHTPGGVATPKSANHPSTSNNCELCHTTTPLLWVPFITPLNHAEVLGSCVSCHTPGGVATPKSANHPSTSNNCELCHTTTPLLWVPFITPLNHTEVLGTCVSCHTPGGIATPKSAGHPSTSNNCELCHTTTPLLWVPFITPLNHAEVLGTCVSCHTPGGIATPKSANHPSTTNNCELCHTVSPLVWTPVISPLNHNEVTGSCVSCHTPGGIATPKSANHPSTSNNCELCHTVSPLVWIPFITPLNHNEVLGLCVSCHITGGVAAGKPAGHPATSDVCEACHNVPPLTWLPFIAPLDHAEVLGTCVSCHTPGGVAVPKSANHSPTTDVCEACHDVPPVPWSAFITPLDHAQVLGTCVICHSVGGVATPKSANHPSTSDLCDACHNVPPLTWLPFITPLDHNEVVGLCVSCHVSGGVAAGKPAGHPATTDLCDACHNVPPQTWLPFITPLDHLEVLGTCVSCHSPTGIASPKPAGHPLTTDVCEACHSIPPTPWATFITPLDHGQVLGACVDCHTPGGIATPKSATHPLTTDVCEACHLVPPDGWTTFILPFAHSDAQGLCTDCHATGIATPVNAGHCTPLGGDCDLCHSTTSFLNPTADCIAPVVPGVPPPPPGAPPAPPGAPPAPAPAPPAAPPAPGMGGPGGGMGM